MKRNSGTWRTLRFAPIVGALAVGALTALASPEAGSSPDLTEPFDLSGNGITDHWRFPTSPAPDLRDMDEDGGIDHWDYTSTGNFVPLAALEVNWTRWNQLACFKLGSNQCICDATYGSGWTCYQADVGSECYDLNSDAATTKALAELCKDGNMTKLWK